jgi:uncharacterized protein (UPF0276 family)
MQILLDRYPYFGLTLDVQHAYVNDPTMSIAYQLQQYYGDRIVEYHVSGYDKPYLHHPLVQTQQTTICDAIIFRDKPMIIESTFDQR